MRQFRAKVVANCDDPEEKLNYLEQYTSGEAKQIVIGNSYMDAQKGYDTAVKELDEKYGNQDIIVNGFITKAVSWAPIKPDNPKELERFGVFLAECLNAISSLDALKVLEYSDNMKQIVSKLPYQLHDKWRNIVFQTKETGGRVAFSHLVKFVRREAKKANDPTYGREAISMQLRKPPPLKSKINSHVN